MCRVIAQSEHRISRACCFQQRHLVVVKAERLGLGLYSIRQSGDPRGTASIGFTDTDLARCGATTALWATRALLVELSGSLVSFSGPLRVLLYQFYPRGNVLRSFQRRQLGTMK